MQSASNKALIFIELFSKLEVLYQRPRSVFCFTFSPEKFPFPIFRANANKFRLIGLVMISHRFGGGSEQQQAGAAGTPPPVPPPVPPPLILYCGLLYCYVQLYCKLCAEISSLLRKLEMSSFDTLCWLARVWFGGVWISAPHWHSSRELATREHQIATPITSY